MGSVITLKSPLLETGIGVGFVRYWNGENQESAPAPPLFKLTPEPTMLALLVRLDSYRLELTYLVSPGASQPLSQKEWLHIFPL